MSIICEYTIRAKYLSCEIIMDIMGPCLSVSVSVNGCLDGTAECECHMSNTL